MLFLLRFMARKAAVSSPFFILKPMDLRLCSPVSGGSTLVTAAPMSARTWQQNGPAITCVRSRTFSFSSGNIETRSLHLVVAYAFDCGSLLLPREYPSPAQGALEVHWAGITVGERPSTSTPALETADKRTCTFTLLSSGWIVTVRRHALFRHLLRHQTRARMLFDIADELKNLEAHRSPALLRLLGQDPHPL